MLLRASADPKGIYVFACPTCGKRFAHDHEVAPLCTGPSETRDEHELAEMELAEVRHRPRLLA